MTADYSATQSACRDGRESMRRTARAAPLCCNLSPWLGSLFIDESGHDRSTSPYEVLAGVAIQDQAVREVIDHLHKARLPSVR